MTEEEKELKEGDHCPLCGARLKLQSTVLYCENSTKQKGKACRYQKWL